MSSKAKTGSTARPVNYIFDDSGIPDDVLYLGDISVSATTDTPFIVVGDPTTQEYGRLPLSAVGTTSLFTLRAPLTANAATATLSPQEVRVALRDAGGISALVFFVKTSVGAGTSLSGSITLGPTI